jgi:hypothetical protein
MGDITLRTIIGRARRLQKDHYSKDVLLESHLAQGLIKNAAFLIDPSWSIQFLDMDSERPQLDREKLLHAVDCLLYAASILSIQNIDVKTLLRIISSRQKMIRAMHDTAVKYRKIPEDKCLVVLDIDGVIFPYPSLWNRFKEAHHCEGKDVADIKEMYRLSGLKATEPPLPHAPDLISFLQKQGCVVVLMSSRPVNLYPEVYMQTMMFLENYNMKPDLLFFKDHKPLSAELENLWNRVAFFVDDEGRHLAGVKGRNPEVCCVHIVSHDEPSQYADYHFESTEAFYKELIKNDQLQEEYRKRQTEEKEDDGDILNEEEVE